MTDLTHDQAAELEKLFYGVMKDELYDELIQPGQYVYHSTTIHTVTGVGGMTRQLNLYVAEGVSVPEEWGSRPFMPTSLGFHDVRTVEDVLEATSAVRDLALAFAALRRKDNAVGIQELLGGHTSGAEAARKLAETIWALAKS